MRKINAERQSNPQQNHRGVESNAPIAMDVGTIPDLFCGRSAASGSLGEIVMRAVSFFGLGWIKTEAKSADLFAAVGSRPLGGSDGAGEVFAGFASGCKTGLAVTCAGNAGGRRTGIWGDSARETVLTDDGGMTGVVPGFWGSALRTLSCGGSAMTNQVAPKKIAENSFFVTR